MKPLFLLLLLFLNQATFSQTNIIDLNITGKYFYYSDDSLVRYDLELKKDGSYYFYRLEDLVVKAAAGKWKVANDTLLLNSQYQQDAISLKVKESITKDKYVDFGSIANSHGDALLALVFLNKDTAKSFDPADENHKIKSEGIKSISVITGTIISKPYFLTNHHSNKFDIIVNLEGAASNYLFMSNYKMLIKDNALCPIVDNHGVKAAGNPLIRKLNGFNEKITNLYMYR